MINLIVNNGSASKKYSFYNEDGLIISVHYEKEDDNYIKTENLNGSKEKTEITIDKFKNSFEDLIKSVIDKKIIASEDEINKVGIRVVSPGTYFQEHRKIDSIFMENLEEKKNMSPLHIEPVQQEINEVLDRLPKIPFYAISDSNFHKDKPDYASIYSYPKKISKEMDIYRFGYHGLSVSSIVEKLKEGGLPEKIIVCHLGGGSSISAVKNGVSIENSMGYSPVEGVPMATRSGDLDPNSIFSIMDYEGYDTKDMQNIIYKESGIKGISGISSDTRVILAEANKGNKDAELALDYYTYKIKKIIGSYYVVLGGLDAVVFTGTIGNRASEVRRRVCEGLESIGLDIDQSKNKMLVQDEGVISKTDSKVVAYVLETAEMDEMNNILNDISL
jgi:acetate kinase